MIVSNDSFQGDSAKGKKNRNFVEGDVTNRTTKVNTCSVKMNTGSIEDIEPSHKEQ